MLRPRLLQRINSALQGEFMPIVQVHMLEGRDIEKKRILVKKLTDVIIEVCGSPPDQVRVILSDMAFEDYAVGGVLKADSKK
jgi:4-oxalocrotonate tautomerase